MKTKEQLVTEYEAQRDLPRNKRTLIHSNGSYIEAVQLDAFKAGAEWAATRVDNLPNHYAEYARNAIKSAAYKLKEIPK